MHCVITFDFSGKNAVITGAGGGMGEAIALSLLKAGCSVLAIDMKPCPASLSGAGDALTYAQGDLTEPGFVERTIVAAYKRRGRLDYLANVAGVLWFGRDKSLLDMDLKVWDRVFDINLKSMVYTCRSAVPLMKTTGAGSAMVHFSTVQWLRGDPVPQDAYQASKAGVAAISKSLAMQLAADGIRSNTIFPGVARTPMQARWSAEDAVEAAKYVPLRRVGTAQDMANVALFLLSEGAGYITGAEIVVDGGLLLKM
jgi:NAD(P)-dependent dehydrogenase (short-subunit alcohol dehydrogenase family)